MRLRKSFMVYPVWLRQVASVRRVRPGLRESLVAGQTPISCQSVEGEHSKARNDRQSRRCSERCGPAVCCWRADHLRVVLEKSGRIKTGGRGPIADNRSAGIVTPLVEIDSDTDKTSPRIVQWLASGFDDPIRCRRTTCLTSCPSLFRISTRADVLVAYWSGPSPRKGTRVLKLILSAILPLHYRHRPADFHREGVDPPLGIRKAIEGRDNVCKLFRSWHDVTAFDVA